MAGDEARKVLAFEVLPEPFDRIEVRALRREELRPDVVPVERFRFVPTGVIEEQLDLLATLRNFFRHGV